MNWQMPMESKKFRGIWGEKVAISQKKMISRERGKLIGDLAAKSAKSLNDKVETLVSRSV